MLVKRKLVIALLLVSLLGCHHNINTNNPRVVFVNTLLAGAQSSKLVATSLTAAADTLEQLRVQDPEYYAKFRPILTQVAQANDKAIAAIRAATAGDTSVKWQPALLAVVDSLGKEDPTVFGFKNPNSQVIAKVAFASLQAALTAITNTWGSK